MQLYPYQKEGARFLLEKGSGLLADSVGLGKTIQTIAVLKETRAFPTLILCPAILKWQWKEELKLWLPDAEVVVISGNASERKDDWNTPADIYIANYELLLHDLPIISGRMWETMVCDEATRISNCWTKTYRALYNIKAMRRIALTGTPVSNRPNEIWGIINWCYPGILGKYVAFIDRYCIRNIWGGIFSFQRLDELQSRIKPLMIRRLQEEVLPELPPKVVSEVHFILSDKERELYDKIRKELLFEIEKELMDKIENPITIQQTLVKMLRLQQITDHPQLLGSKSIGATKLEVLRELLGELEGKKIILFTKFSTMAELLRKELMSAQPLLVTGDVPNDKRQAIIEDFEGRNGGALLIMTSAGMFGLNLQTASVVIHYDSEWSLAKMTQREGRAHRIGQKENVLIYHLIGKRTIDEYVRKVLHKKQQLSKDILGDGVGAEEIKQMLRYD